MFILFCIAAELPGLIVLVNLSPSEVLKLADHVIGKSKEVHDAVASVPLNQVFVNSHPLLFPLFMHATGSSFVFFFFGF